MTDPERPETTGQRPQASGDRSHTTPEGHTPEEPAPSELGKTGTPGAGMTPAAPHAIDAERIEADMAPAADVGARHQPAVASSEALHDAPAHHDPATHMDAHTALSDDDHGHAEPRLGPIDWSAWGYAAAGALIGVLIAALFYVAII